MADVDSVANKVGPYTIVRRIAGGGQASVYKVRDADGEVFAAKVFVRAQMSAYDLKTATRELAIGKKLRSGHFARVVDWDLEAPDPYIVQEFITGMTVRKWVDSRPPADLLTVLSLATDISAGVAALHEAGMAHRDLSANNVMVTSGRNSIGMIIDLGFATKTPDGKQSSVFFGTPGWLPGLWLDQVHASPKERDVFNLGQLVALLSGAQLGNGSPPSTGAALASLQGRVHPLLWPVVRAIIRDTPSLIPAARDVAQQLAALRDLALESREKRSTLKRPMPQGPKSATPSEAINRNVPLEVNSLAETAATADARANSGSHTDFEDAALRRRIAADWGQMTLPSATEWAREMAEKVPRHQLRVAEWYKSKRDPEAALRFHKGNCVLCTGSHHLAARFAGAFLSRDVATIRALDGGLVLEEIGNFQLPISLASPLVPLAGSEHLGGNYPYRMFREVAHAVDVRGRHSYGQVDNKRPVYAHTYLMLRQCEIAECGDKPSQDEIDLAVEVLARAEGLQASDPFDMSLIAASIVTGRDVGYVSQAMSEWRVNWAPARWHAAVLLARFGLAPARSREVLGSLVEWAHGAEARAMEFTPRIPLSEIQMEVRRRSIRRQGIEALECASVLLSIRSPYEV